MKTIVWLCLSVFLLSACAHHQAPCEETEACDAEEETKDLEDEFETFKKQQRRDPYIQNQ